MFFIIGDVLNSGYMLRFKNMHAYVCVLNPRRHMSIFYKTLKNAGSEYDRLNG